MAIEYTQEGRIMKKTCLLLFCVLVLFVSTGMQFFAGDVGTSGSWTEEATQDFTAGGSPPTGWSEKNGSFTASGGVMASDVSTSNQVILYTSEQLDSATQFVKVEFDLIPAATFDGIVFRSPNNTYGPRYVLRYYQGGPELNFGTCGNGVDSHTCSYWAWPTQTLNSGDILAASITGSDSSTELKIWVNPDAGAAPALWGPPDHTYNSSNWNTTPTTYCNTGTYAGIFASGSGHVDFDNWSAGSFQ